MLIIWASMTISIFVIFMCVGLANSQGELFKLNLISQEGGASCLDGSAPGYYIHEGFGQNKNKYLLYFAGGGFCGQATLSDTLQSCYRRSSTNLGSTKNASPTMNTTGKGLLSTLESQNQLFYDWTKVGIIYCDGHEYIGYRQNPISYKDRNLYFRGSRNVKQLFRQLNNRYDMYNGDTIIITGVSAGGMASFQWGDYLLENTKKAKVYSMPDSGFFITDFYSQVVGKKMLRQDAGPLMNLVYNQTQTPQAIKKCVEQPGFDLIDCLNVANYAKYLNVPLFVIESPYDQWSLRYIIGAQCLTNPKAPFSIQSCNDTVRKVIEDYRTKSIQYIKNIKETKKSVTVWGPACVQHGYSSYPSWNNQSFVVDQVTLMQAVERFLSNPSDGQWLLDERAWPENKGCSGTVNYNQLMLDILSD